MGISSVVVMSGVAEEKCSNCCELSIGFKATSGRCCEWNHCCEWSSCCEWSHCCELSIELKAHPVVVVSGVTEEKLSSCH